MTLRTRLARLEARSRVDAPADLRARWWAGMAAAERDLPSAPCAGTGQVLAILDAVGAFDGDDSPPWWAGVLAEVVTIEQGGATP